jgi:hypothetical protein
VAAPRCDGRRRGQLRFATAGVGGCAAWRAGAGPHVRPLGETRLGRDPARCAVLVDERTVSREHASLVPDVERSAWRLQRLSQSGHVFVNGRAVTDAFLAPGDQIQVGTSVLVLEVA